MSELKEENPVQDTENQAAETAEKPRKHADSGFEILELIYEKNKKVINYVGGGLAVIIGVFVFFKFYYLPEQEKEASNEIFWAQQFFEKDSFNIALKGGSIVYSPDGQKPMKGFEQIADEYGMTKSGNLANYCAGVCYMRTGKYEQAIEFLTKYNGKDEVISSIALGATGDCYMELKKPEEAVKFYLKAAGNSNNTFTSPLYIKKAALAYELIKDFRSAVMMYERIKKEFNGTTLSRDIDRNIARAQALGNM